VATCIAVYQAINHSEWNLSPARKKVIGIAVGLLILLLVQTPIRNQWKKEHIPNCLVTVSESSEVTSRVYRSGPIPGRGKGPYNMFTRFQELFYSWDVIINSNVLSKETTVVISRLKRTDDVVVLPNDSLVQEPEPHYIDALHQGEPESYSRIVRFSPIGRDVEGKITVRRPIDEDTKLTYPDILTASVRAGECPIRYTNVVTSTAIQDLNKQVKNIVRRVSDALRQTVEVKHYSPSDDDGFSTWMTSDWKCADATCTLPIPIRQSTVYFNSGYSGK
jgi:hypothetical protein